MTDPSGGPAEPAAAPTGPVPPAAGADRAGHPPARVTVLLTTIGLGVVVGLVGTVAHRGLPPWGLVVAVLATLAAAVFARGLGTGLGLAGYAGGLLAITQLANALRPGGDVLVAADALGYAWLTLPLLTVGVAAFLPHGWFAREPVDGPPPEAP